MYAIEEDLFIALNSFVRNNTYIIIYCKEMSFTSRSVRLFVLWVRRLVFKQFIHGVFRSGSSNSLNSRLFERNLNPVGLVVRSDDDEVDGIVSVLHYA